MAQADLNSRMVDDLRNCDVDLGDERDVIQKLHRLGYRAGDIVTSLDVVIEETRRRGLKRTWA
jgi:hypothetical protein